MDYLNVKISVGRKSGGKNDAVTAERITTATMTPTARRTARKSLRDTSRTRRMQSSFCRSGFMAAGIGIALIWRTTSFRKGPLFFTSGLCCRKNCFISLSFTITFKDFL